MAIGEIYSPVYEANGQCVLGVAAQSEVAQSVASQAARSF